MMLFLLARKMYEAGIEVARDIHHVLTAPPSEQEQREACLRRALALLNVESGHLVDVYAAVGTYQRAKADDVQISIIFKVEARPRQYVEQHVSYAVEIKSWKALGRDLDILGDHFAKAYIRSNPTEDVMPEELLYEYSQMVNFVYSRAEGESRHPS